jgi:ribonuclease T1
METGSAPEGYVGGRTFQNRERKLPMNDADGNKIIYQEWDINPKINGVNRGKQRLVTGSDGRNWYTGNHYVSFIQMKKN